MHKTSISGNNAKYSLHTITEMWINFKVLSNKIVQHALDYTYITIIKFVIRKS